MAMKLITARERATDYRFVVQLDDAREPEGENRVELAFGKDRPSGMTRAEHIAQLKGEVRLLCLEQLARLEAARGADQGTALAGEGQAL
jgi:hypothetical protein